MADSIWNWFSRPRTANAYRGTIRRNRDAEEKKKKKGPYVFVFHCRLWSFKRNNNNIVHGIGRNQR